MQLSEVGFLLAFFLPPVAVIAGACAVLGASFVYSRPHAGDQKVTLTLHHPVGH